ncbi:hypothetical protein SAMN05192539_1002265 [Paraburkholderia diazotrophica]|uniref:Uncharacterized protein n=1 Tax=Paraburkholderia diazotrophica TaxID=667676 RepID=A0A1H6RTF6_9BURK|nr:hypothetical protein SAMN05192539_1002265 [Paraburkholderia diazotrophica]
MIRPLGGPISGEFDGPRFPPAAPAFHLTRGAREAGQRFPGGFLQQG